ncbi:MAG: VWA domain-containing protein [Pyrinomonadaceae bacterium]|nr:VWA domain-containing protein [Pyrinomonadaceae bacterium]
MPFKALSLKRYLCVLLFCLCALAFTASAQQEQTDEVVRVSSNLIQTDVMVFDKQGRFVRNLPREQFELRIDGKLKPITFFELVKTGSISEDAQLAAARGEARTNVSGSAASTDSNVVPLDRARVVLFYIDDLHLAADSIQRVRNFLLNFIENEMGQNDEAWISSASGQIGFLQQPTGDKTVLRAAVERLKTRSTASSDFERPPMSEHQALSIEKGDQGVLDFFVERFSADNPTFPRQSAVEIVRRRAISRLQQAAGVTTNTFASLNNVILSSAQLPGRKLLFFISDGFLIDDQLANVPASMRRIADSAARSGVVIYSIDARGLISSTDSSAENAATVSPRLTHANAGDVTATQEVFRALASDTGGRAMLNTNVLQPVATAALKETNTYYLLAWRPEDENPSNKFRRIEVSVVGRPELVVRVRRGFLEQDEKAESRRNTAAANDARRAETKQATQNVLFKAIKSGFPLNSLPTSLFVSYADAPSIGTYVTVSMEMENEGLQFSPVEGKQTAIIDLAGAIYNDQGKPVSGFQNKMRVHPPVDTSVTRKQGLVYNYQARLKPGLYQVRVAARDPGTGRTGSALQWIEIPDLATRKLSLSSVIVGERVVESTVPQKDEETAKNTAGEEVFFSVSRRFTRSSSLRFATNIYNAALSKDGEQTPDVALQVQILRDHQPVLTTTLSKVATKGVPDMTRLPYAAEISLGAIPAGRYLLQVTVIDRIAKTSAIQRVSFEIG